MLSRHAEGLFWIGRYIERVSDVSRMLDVAYETQLERNPERREKVWRDLLDVLYLAGEFDRLHPEATTSTINQFLILESNPTSLASAVRQARNNTMNVRDVVPVELLQSVNRLHTLFVSGQMADELEANPHSAYGLLMERCREVSGAVSDSMARDDGFRFLMLGRFLERAEMTCRMIEVNRATSPADVAAWYGALRSVSGLHAFTQRYGPLAEIDVIVGFLLVDPEFPFSVMFCFEECEKQLAAAGVTGSWESTRVLGRVKSDLQYAQLPPVASGELEGVLKRLELGIRDVTQALHVDLYQFGGEPSIFSFEAL